VAPAALDVATLRDALERQGVHLHAPPGSATAAEG
jgi:hypothetical protein